MSNIAGDGRIFVATWLPAEARQKLRHIDGLADDLHMTVLYVTEGIDTPVKRRQVLDAIEEVCARTPPIKCALTEVGVMGNDVKTLVANVTVMGGSCFYADLIETIEKKVGHHLERDYDFLPHVTLLEKTAGGTADIKDLRKYRWTADEITVQFGGDGFKKFNYELTGAIRRVAKRTNVKR
jgi:2'-5' RNA ligase